MYNIVFRIIGLLLLVFFAFSDIVAFPIRLVGFIIVYTAISGAEIGIAKEYGRKEGILLLAKLENLKPGSFSFAMTPIQERHCSLTKNCSRWYAFVERNEGGIIPVEIGVSDRIDITKATEKKFISGIKEGESFKINENHEITRI